MNKNDQLKEEVGNPEKVYRDERNNKGSIFGDTASETSARDAAKMDKALSGETQKMDGVHPDELEGEEEDRIAEESRKETLENK